MPPGPATSSCSAATASRRWSTRTRIKQILIESKNLKSAVSKLIDTANKEGGRDNITAVAFRLEEGEQDTEEGATLIAATAEQAGLTAERVREAARRMRPDAAAAAMTPRQRWIRRGLAAAAVLGVLVLAVIGVRSLYFVGTTPTAESPSTAASPMTCRSGSTSMRSSTRSGSRPRRLSAERQEVVTEHKIRTHDDAVDIVTDIEQREGAIPPVTPPTPAPAPPQTQKKKPTQGAGADQGAAGGGR